MFFFARDLIDGINGSNTRTARRSMVAWQRNGAFYNRYFDLIAPLLPSALSRIHKNTLHDSIVIEVRKHAKLVELKLRGNDTLGGWRKRIVILKFLEVHRARVPRNLLGTRWSYDEAHLADSGRFRFCANFSNGAEIYVEAEALRITVLR